MKKLLSGFLLVFLSNFMANAEIVNVEIGKMRYELNRSTSEATIKGPVDQSLCVTDLVIPNSVTYKDSKFTVTTIGKNAFAGCSGLTGSLTIPNSVTFIGSEAFAGCSGFKGPLTIPNSVTTIGNEAFAGCSGFTGSLTIPNSVTLIGYSAFYDCSGFTGSLNIGGSVTTIGKNAFAGCSGLTGSLTIPNSVTTIGSYAFDSCSGFTGSLTISNSVTNIGDAAFLNCRGFTGSLNIGGSVTTIGSYAFAGCSGLTGSLTIPNSVTNIGDAAFQNCSGFTGSLTIPNSVTTIGDAAFAGCRGFTGSLNIGGSVTTIGERAFLDCRGFTGSLNIDGSVTTIGERAFAGCRGFKGPLTIPNSVTTIGERAFYDCRGFTGSLNIGGSVTTIGSYAFAGCSGLTGSLTIPNSVTNIGDAAFFNCRGFTGSLSIPGSLVKIGDSAFATYSDSGFSDVTYHTDNPITAKSSVFSNYSPTLYVFSNGIEIATTIEPWKNFQNIEPIPIAVTGIKLSQTQVVIKIADTLQLEVSYSPDNTSEKALTWQSSNEAVATVDENGNVTAVSVGEATITASVASNTDISASCTVTVQPVLVESITLNTEATLIEVGGTIQLTATVLPENATDKSVTWTSYDETVAKVDENGLVTAVSIGETVIFVATNSGSASGAVLGAYCTVTVRPKLAESITLNTEAASVEVGGTVQLEVTFVPDDATDKTVTWQSSNEAVATVDENGLVTAVSVGSAIILATTKDDSNLTAYCTVTVEPIFAEFITLDCESALLKTGETIQLTATVLPENTTEKSVAWISSDSEIATVDENGLVTAIKAGDVVITAVTIDGTDISAECHINVQDDYSGIGYMYNDNVTVKVTDSTIVIEGLESGVQTALFSIDGRTLGTQKSGDIPPVYHVNVSGIYIVRVGNKSYKIMVR